MQAKPLKASLLHTLKTFWTGKRFLKLFIFALLMGNVTLYCVGIVARRQVMTNSISHHNKVYTAYLQAVERARKVVSIPQPGAPSPEASGEGELTKPESENAEARDPKPSVSPYWVALRDVRRQFPFYRLNVALQGATDGERDKRVLDLLKNRPRGWNLTDETEGWARTFYVLPTRNVAAFQVVSYVRDDLNEWENTAILIGIYAFLLLFAFGWFWTRALDDSAAAVPDQPFGSSGYRAEMRERIAALGAAAREMESVLGELLRSVDEAERAIGELAGSGAVAALDEIVAQVRLLALNGSIEAARSPEAYRVFHVVMHEINQLATQARDLLKGVAERSVPAEGFAAIRRKIRDAQRLLPSETAGAGEAGQSRHGTGTSVRRVG